MFFIVFFIENTYSSSNFINYPKYFSWKCNNFNEISFNNYNDTLGFSYNHKHNHKSNNVQLFNIKNNFPTQILNNDFVNNLNNFGVVFNIHNNYMAITNSKHITPIYKKMGHFCVPFLYK